MRFLYFKVDTNEKKIKKISFFYQKLEREMVTIFILMNILYYLIWILRKRVRIRKPMGP